MGSKKGSYVESVQGPFNNPFAALRGAAQGVGSSAPSEPVRVEETQDARDGLPRWARLRLERKGRGGKEVTIVECGACSAQQLEFISKRLRATLGCGGGVEQGSAGSKGSCVVLQGDQRERAAQCLSSLGVVELSVVSAAGGRRG